MFVTVCCLLTSSCHVNDGCASSGVWDEFTAPASAAGIVLVAWTSER